MRGDTFYIAENKCAQCIIDKQKPAAGVIAKHMALVYSTKLKSADATVFVQHDIHITAAQFASDLREKDTPASGKKSKSSSAQRTEALDEIIECDELSEAAKTIRYWPVIIEDPAD